MPLKAAFPPNRLDGDQFLDIFQPRDRISKVSSGNDAHEKLTLIMDPIRGDVQALARVRSETSSAQPRFAYEERFAMSVITVTRTTMLPSGELIPVLGQGTWHMAEEPPRRADEIAALRLGIDIGMTLIDTAEMYADGGAEELVGEAIEGRRDEVFLVSKVLPHHATRRGAVEACDRSLERLDVETIDLYLLHWRGPIPLEETIDAFDALIGAGKIRYWGVSNFDLDDMTELVDLTGGEEVATDQVLYNLEHRGIEFDLLPWCQRCGLPVIAYSPIEQGRLLRHPGLIAVAARHSGVTPAQVALAWVLRQDGVCAIPRAGTPAHVRENRAALDIRLTSHDLADLDRAFPPPTSKQLLAML
jgi:diketogulonate reductase-like aldo/keto reductase